MWSTGTKSPVYRLFIQQLAPYINKENSKTPQYCPSWRGIHWWLVYSPHKGPVMQQAFPIYDINTLRPRQHGRHFADVTFKLIFLNENLWISIWLKLVPKGPINNIPALVQTMAWRRPDDKRLFEPMMVSLLTHICVNRPQWVKSG